MLKRIKKMLPIGVVGVALLALAACNTVEGAGEDIEKAGDSIQDAAE